MYMFCDHKTLAMSLDMSLVNWSTVCCYSVLLQQHTVGQLTTGTEWGTTSAAVDPIFRSQSLFELIIEFLIYLFKQRQTS